MSVEALRAQLPEYAKDLRLNLESVLSETGAPGLEPRQARAVAFASAIASRHRPLVEALENSAGELLSPAELGGVRAAAAMMAMTNVYYRFTHLASNKEYETMYGCAPPPAALISSHSVWLIASSWFSRITASM